MNNEPPNIPAVAVRPRRGLPKWAVALLVLALAFCGFLGFRVVQFAKYVREHPRQPAPGEEAFREANRQIIGNEGKTAFGNNEVATALARDYAKSLKIMRENLFTKSKDDGFSITKGEFLTYCQWNGDSCVFLVHVPELRHFTAEAKDSLSELAWINAQSVMGARHETPPKTLAVGIKGAMLYERIMVGKFVADPKKDGDGIETSGSGLRDLKLFYPFFATKEELAKP